jgi:cytidylate kinase
MALDNEYVYSRLNMSQWYQKLVDKVFSQEMLVDEINQEAGDSPYFSPFITVSRDPGSGGKPIAELVAKQLGYTFYNKKLLDEIAKSANMRREALDNIDEKTRSLIDDLVHNVLNPDYISERKYITHLCKVVLSVAQKGKSVILGRGSNFITPRPYGLHVRVTAPYRVCVSRAVQFEKVPYKKAREIVGDMMNERAAFVKQYFNKDIINPKYYDISLNTTYLSIESAAEIIVTAFKKKFPKAY